MEKIIEKFIKDNNLDFSETGSGLNSACTILSGYALYIGAEEAGAIKKVLPEASHKEFDRVFEYANYNNYGDYWTSEEAKKMYVITEI